MKHELDNATDFILSGDSAGGCGVWPQLDWLSSTALPSTRVVGAPIAGFYFKATPYQGNYTLNRSRYEDYRDLPSNWPRYYQLFRAYVDESCKAALPDAPWACLLSAYVYPYIDTPVFVTEALTDKIVLNMHNWVENDTPYGVYNLYEPVMEYARVWSNTMGSFLRSFAPSSSAKNGYFAPACYIHTLFTVDMKVDGLSYMDVFSNWYFQREGPSQLADTCGILCNPTCCNPKQTSTDVSCLPASRQATGDLRNSTIYLGDDMTSPMDGMPSEDAVGNIPTPSRSAFHWNNPVLISGIAIAAASIIVLTVLCARRLKKRGSQCEFSKLSG